MGIIYLAEDTKLERRVAIKFLPQHVTIDTNQYGRFKIEAKTAAALNHSNIATIHAIEEVEDAQTAQRQIFIVMECVKGRELKELIRGSFSQNLSSQLPVADVINYATQIAAGLNAAHKMDIIHRDIKSSNIMLTDDGQIKIMDFGLAKFGKEVESSEKKTPLTEVGSTIGTGPYMSPEQARGEEVDYRTDIWSFGIVLYELLVGQVPFSGEYEQALLYSVINDDYTPVSEYRDDIPEELQNIIIKSLQKKPENRFNSMDEILVMLKKLGSASAASKEKTAVTASKQKRAVLFGPKCTAAILVILAILFFFPLQGDNMFSRSIAVLPFENMNQDKESEYFSNGITEDFITQLSKIGNLRIISRTSSMRYRKSDKSLREIGNELNVAYILEGSVHRSDQRIRIVDQLIDSQSDEHVWAET
jgi:serine/threonine protein kinase